MLPILNPFSGTDHRDRLIYEWAGSGATEANIFSFTRPGMKYIFLPIFHVPMDIKNREAYKRSKENSTVPELFVITPRIS